MKNIIGLICLFTVAILLGYYTIHDMTKKPVVEQEVTDNKDLDSFYRHDHNYEHFDADYCLMTKYKDEAVFDYGSFKYIDSLKCIRFTEMTKKMKTVDSIADYVENRINRVKKDLKLLNKPCN